MERYTQTEIVDVGNLFFPLCRKGITLNLTPTRITQNVVCTQYVVKHNLVLEGMLIY